MTSMSNLTVADRQVIEDIALRVFREESARHADEAEPDEDVGIEPPAVPLARLEYRDGMLGPDDEKSWSDDPIAWAVTWLEGATRSISLAQQFGRPLRSGDIRQWQWLVENDLVEHTPRGVVAMFWTQAHKPGWDRPGSEGWTLKKAKEATRG